MTDRGMFELADRFFGAIEAGDEATLDELLAPDCTVYANFLDTANDRATTLRILRWLHANVRDLRYDVRGRDVIDGGFVQQHVLRAQLADGQELAVPACLVVRVDDHRIAHIDEYLDSARLAALMAQAG
jgi:uncharacterized protein